MKKDWSHKCEILIDCRYSKILVTQTSVQLSPKQSNMPKSQWQSSPASPLKQTCQKLPATGSASIPRAHSLQKPSLTSTCSFSTSIAPDIWPTTARTKNLILSYQGVNKHLILIKPPSYYNDGKIIQNQKKKRQIMFPNRSGRLLECTHPKSSNVLLPKKSKRVLKLTKLEIL